MDYKIDLSQGQLEGRSERSKFWYKVIGVTLFISGIAMLGYAIYSGSYELGLNTYNLIILPFVFILPATGWYYSYFSSYLQFSDQQVVYKAQGKSKQVWSVVELVSISFQNKHLSINLKSGETEDFHLDSPNLNYAKIQEMKDQVAKYNQHVLRIR
jgi:hypothetical protein